MGRLKDQTVIRRPKRLYFDFWMDVRGIRVDSHGARAFSEVPGKRSKSIDFCLKAP
jgi:hypothetical protein